MTELKGLRPSQVAQITHTRERILTVAGPGAGKTFSLLTIARLSVETGSDAHFHIVDSDEAVARVLVDPAFRVLWNDDMTGLRNITIYPVSNWVELISTLAKIQGKLEAGKFTTRGLMRDHDWLAIDSLTPSWQWVQDWFSREVFNQGLDEYFLAQRVALRADAKKLDGMEGFKDWPVINQVYSELQDRILRSPGNVYCTAEAKAIDRSQAEKMDKNLYSTFGAYGIVPAGNKRVPFLFSTILWLIYGGSGAGVWEVTSVKDRSRKLLEAARVKDFARDYLVKVGGWQDREPVDVEAVLAAARAKKEAATANQGELVGVAGESPA